MCRREVRGPAFMAFLSVIATIMGLVQGQQPVMSLPLDESNPQQRLRGIRQVNGRRQRKRCTKIEQTREKSHKGAAKAKEGGGADGMVCPGLWLT